MKLLKPEQFDLNDETIFVDMLLHPRDVEQHKKFYVGMGIIAVIAACFFIIPLIIFMSQGLAGCVLCLPFILSLILYIPVLLQAKVISDYGVFITNRKGKVKRGYLWSEIKETLYKRVNSEESRSVFKVMIKPYKGQVIAFSSTYPDVSAHILTFCVQKISNGNEQSRDIIYSFEKRNKLFTSLQEEDFNRTLQRLVTNEMTIQHLNKQKQLSLGRFAETNFKIYKK